MSRLITSAKSTLVDNFGRQFPYLRLSITDICNFSCSYCLPNGYQCNKKSNFLSTNEIRRLVCAFAKLGVNKIRITGGEPTVRQDFTEIASIVSNQAGISTAAFTTNGYRLKENALKWKNAGLKRINISIDSLQANRFKKITGHDRLDDILDGIEAALNAGFEQVKVNVVLLRNVNDKELPDYLALAKRLPISVRFIELMQTGDNLSYFKKYHLPAKQFRRQLNQKHWQARLRKANDGPAQIFTHPDYQGSMGFIAPYDNNFCEGCNRLRVTALGDLRLCLFGNQGIALRHLLQHDNQLPQLIETIQSQLAYKASSHFLADGNTGITPHLASTGG